MTYDALQNESHLSGFRWVKVIGKVRTMESMGIYPGCLEACAGGFVLAGDPGRRCTQQDPGYSLSSAKFSPQTVPMGKKNTGENKRDQKTVKKISVLCFSRSQCFFAAHQNVKNGKKRTEITHMILAKSMYK